MAFTLVCPATRRSQDAQRSAEPRCRVEAGVARADPRIQALLSLVREHRGHALEAGMAAATASSVAEMARFARELQEDPAAVTAGLTLTWSNGVTEGHVHRLTREKHQGYGRAGFALLRQRVLHTA